MKISKTICLMLCIVTVFCGVTGVCAAEYDVSVSAGCHSVDASVAIGGSEKMVDTAKAVVLYERSTGTLVYSYQPDEKIYPSSMVKLMTAIVALEEGNLTDVVTVTRSALDSVAIGSVSAGLSRGEEISLYDLLMCMMVASANDASAVIAEHIAGSQEAFVALMNDKAAELGCTGTHFSNVHGLDHEENYTTARDILRILETGLNIPDFKAMFETASYTVPATNKSEERLLHTTNHMMSTESIKKYLDERVTGGKTGATDKAGRCLAVTATIGDMELIGIVMGAKATYSSDGSYLTRFGSFEEMAEILDYAQDHFERRQLFYENQVISQYPVANGSNNVVTMPVSAGYCVLPKSIQPEQLRWEYAVDVDHLTAPVAQGEKITSMEVWYGDICLARTDLVAMNAVSVFVPYSEPKDDTDAKNEQAHGEILAMILGVILVIAVLVIAGFFMRRVIQTMIIKARIRRRRRERRRNRNARME